MEPTAPPNPDRDEDWPTNYFNYFTEIEEHFQRARGTSLFLLSPLDWALVATWKQAGIPLEAVLRGIDSAFEKWRSRKKRTQQVNSLAYCAQAIMTEAQRLADASTGQPAPQQAASKAPFSPTALGAFLRANGSALGASVHTSIQELGTQLLGLAARADELLDDLEDLERRLTAMEEKMLAQLRLAQADEELLQARRELETQLRPYRSKMSGEQLRQLEEQYLSRRLLEKAGLPRLSLFYMTDLEA